MKIDIQKLIDDSKDKKYSKLSDAQLKSIENLINTSKDDRSKGGKKNINNLNEKNRKSNHWRKLGDLKIGIARDNETKRKIQKGSSHSWREISQFSRDGNWIKDWPNLVSIKNELGFNHTNICACCQNKPKYKTAYGFIWKYKK